jgi:hypothetical protein
VSAPVFMFCVPGLVFNGTVVVGYHFLVLRAQTSIRQFRGLRVPFSVIVHTYSFSTVPRASGPVFMFCVPGLFSAVSKASSSVFMSCAPRLIFDGYQGRRVPFSCFAIPD